MSVREFVAKSDFESESSDCSCLPRFEVYCDVDMLFCLTHMQSSQCDAFGIKLSSYRAI